MNFLLSGVECNILLKFQQTSVLVNVSEDKYREGLII